MIERTLPRAVLSALAVLGTLASAAPLSGDARHLVERLGRAGRVDLRQVDFDGERASGQAARAFAAARRCLSEPTLTRLQGAPRDPGVRALAVLEFRCVNGPDGRPLTPASALALLRALGFDLAAGGLDAFLNNPPPTNELRAAARRAVTPLTPDN